MTTHTDACFSSSLQSYCHISVSQKSSCLGRKGQTPGLRMPRSLCMQGSQNILTVRLLNHAPDQISLITKGRSWTCFARAMRSTLVTKGHPGPGSAGRDVSQPRKPSASLCLWLVIKGWCSPERRTNLQRQLWWRDTMSRNDSAGRNRDAWQRCRFILLKQCTHPLSLCFVAAFENFLFVADV